MTLQILVSTLDKGINNVAQLVLEPKDGISYLVSWQHSNDEKIELPKELKRNDVEIHNLEGRGLSRNRNNCLRHASADVCLIADDDCTYTHKQLQEVIDTFKKNPDVDIATFKFTNNQKDKLYPSTSQNLTKFPKGYYVSSIEIAFRREKVQGSISFNEFFGLGAEPFHCGEEHIFIMTSIEKGLTCRFFPIFITTHTRPFMDIRRDQEPGNLMTYGAILQLYESRTKYLRILLKAWRLWRHRDVPFFFAIKHMHNGMKYIDNHPEIMNE